MVIINYAHPVTPSQQQAMEVLVGQPIERTLEINAQFDPALPFGEQVRKLIEQTGLTAQEWQTLPLIINLPSLNVIAALLLAELHGRMGYFPAIVRLRPVADAVPPQFEVAEILNLQAVRDAARARR
jgi:hypothetical protein